MICNRISNLMINFYAMNACSNTFSSSRNNCGAIKRMNFCQNIQEIAASIVINHCWWCLITTCTTSSTVSKTATTTKIYGDNMIDNVLVIPVVDFQGCNDKMARFSISSFIFLIVALISFINIWYGIFLAILINTNGNSDEHEKIRFDYCFGFNCDLINDDCIITLVYDKPFFLRKKNDLNKKTLNLHIQALFVCLV